MGTRGTWRAVFLERILTRVHWIAGGNHLSDTEK